MEDFFRNLKQKISIDKIVDFMKEANLVDEDKPEEKDVHETVETVEPNKTEVVEEIATKHSNTVVQSKSKIEETENQSDNVESSDKTSLSVLQKPTEQRDLTEEEEIAKHEDIITFYN